MQQACDWDGLETLSLRTIELEQGKSDDDPGTPLSPFTFLRMPTPTTAAQQLRCAQRLARQHMRLSPEPPPVRATSLAAAQRSTITIGYLSADFHMHATAMLMAELFEKHDHQRFRVIGYSYGPDDGSPMRQATGAVHLIDSSTCASSLMPRVAERIAADEVDILIDLKGYTKAEPAAQILALRPAPIQVNYLGYPGTMGAPFIDYILVDDFVVPADQQPYLPSRLVHLPGCYQVNDSRARNRAATPIAAPNAACRERGFVFCSFNNNYKITPEVFDVWMRLLAAVPGSVLWLLEGNRFAAANLRREAEARGIAPERLVFAPHVARPSTWRATAWPICFSTRFRSTPTRPPATRCGPDVRW